MNPTSLLLQKKRKRRGKTRGSRTRNIRRARAIIFGSPNTADVTTLPSNNVAGVALDGRSDLMLSTLTTVNSNISNVSGSPMLSIANNNVNDNDMHAIINDNSATAGR